MPIQKPSAPAARTGSPHPLRIRRINPLDYEGQLKHLMAANGYMAFAGLFDRGYPAAVADGGASYVGFDATGRIRMTMTQFIHRFAYRGTRLVSGMLGNMMVAPEHRTFFPALSMVRGMLRDTRERGVLDFVYGDPNPGAAAIVRGAKMEHVGDLDRLVLPIADARLAHHIAARIYARAARLRGLRSPDVCCVPAETYDLSMFEAPLGPADRILAHQPASMLRRRLDGFPDGRDYVVELRLSSEASAWDALVLLRLAEDTNIVSIGSIRRRDDVPLRAIIPVLAPIARRIGGHRLQIETLLDSKLAREFTSLGFVARGNIVPIYATAFTEAGREAMSNVADWEVTTVDMER